MPRFENGWVKSYRSQLDGDLIKNVHLFAIWNWMLLSATWKEHKTILDGKQITLPPGSLVFGIRELSSTFGISSSTGHRLVHYLHDTERIFLEIRTQGCIATIRNWEEYQSGEDLTERYTNAERTVAERKPNPNEEVKKERSNILDQSLDQIEQIYRSYPRKRGKKKGLDKAKSLIKENPEQLEKLKQSVINYATHCKNKKIEENYIQHFSTFMNGGWEDWCDVEKPREGKTFGSKKDMVPNGRPEPERSV